VFDSVLNLEVSSKLKTHFELTVSLKHDS